MKQVLLWVLLSALLLAGCGTDPTPAATPTLTAMPLATESATSAPTAPALPTAAATSALATAVPAGQRIQIAEAGLSVEPPGGWQRLEPDWAWTPPGIEGQRVGLKWADLPPPQEAEAALLPGNSEVLSSEAAAVPWGQARRVTLVVYGPAQAGQGEAPVVAVETHVLVVTSTGGQRRGYDFYASARAAEELSALHPVLDRLVESAIPLGE